MSVSLFAFVLLIVALVTVCAAYPDDGIHYCGNTVREAGILKSPPPVRITSRPETTLGRLQDTECTWTIEAPKNKIVVIKFTQIFLDAAWHDGCSNNDDHIEIFDGLSTDEEKQLAIICDRRNSTLVFSSTENTLTVQLKTDHLRQNGGFISEVIFTYPPSAGCGGNINLGSNNDYILKPPQVAAQANDIFDCKWNFVAPKGMAIKVTFTSFEIECQFDHGVEIRDGNYADSLLLGSYCGSTIPPVILSSSYKLSIRLSSNIQSNFTALLEIQEETCNSSLRFVGNHKVTLFTSPGYDTVSLARGIHCGGEIRAFNSDIPTVVRIKNLDIQPGSLPGKCDKDKFIIGTRSSFTDISNKGAHFLYQTTELDHMYDGSIFVARQYELCGTHKLLDFYFPETVFLNLITTPDVLNKAYKGVEVEVFYGEFCGRNYTEPSGRVMNGPRQSSGNCATLISAPNGYSISLYFISFKPHIMQNIYHLNIYDGESTDSTLLSSTKECGWSKCVVNPVFSTSNHLLLYNIGNKENFDLNYMITNKGRGCGGYLYSDQGVVTSPFYPKTYNESKSCEWELETPVGTRTHLRFADFDLGDACTSNYVQLLNREGKVLTTLCSEKPNLYTSEENYIKIVSVTTTNNTGKGWKVLFVSVS